jgi:L-rhamnose isomerase
METKQSSIEWLGLYIKGISTLNTDEIIEKAKEMHKQEIVEAYRFGLSDEYVIGSQKYYNEHFGK